MAEEIKPLCCNQPELHFVLHRSWRSVLPRLIIAVLVTIAIIWASIAYSVIGPQLALGLGLTVTLPVFLLVLLVLIMRPVLLLYDCKHEVTCHHIRSTQGICSVRRQFIEIPYEDMLGVRASQSIMERFLGVGSIIIWTASADIPDLTMKGISDPEKYTRLIGTRIDNAIIDLRRSKANRNQ